MVSRRSLAPHSCQIGQLHQPLLSEVWPELPWPEWTSTAETLDLWMQMIGKIRLALATKINHWWHVAFYLTCRGMTTSPMPYGNWTLQIDFDFLTHRLIFQRNDGLQESLDLKPMPVATFYEDVMALLDRLGCHVHIWTMPVEIPNPIPFDQDTQHAAYDADYVSRFWKILLQTERVFTEFRARFLGKVSPVHFFWGSFDLALSRFSGRPAPLHSSVPNISDQVVQTAYSHEVSSCGFWPGGAVLPEPVFYAYAYPAPPGFADTKIQPSEAYFNQTLGEFILPYETMRQAPNPAQYLLEFLQTTYEATANLGNWPRRELEVSSSNPI